MKKIQEGKIVGYETINGEQVPIINPEVHMEVKNIKTGIEYDSELHANNDIADPNTSTVEEDIQKNVLLKVVKLPDVFGKNEDE